MALLDWLTGKDKPLSSMNRQELRRQELLLEKECTQLLRRIEKLGQEKQALFERGAAEKMPEVRRMLAQQFEVKTSEQLLLSRQLNIRSKESMTVTRLKLLRENAERARLHGNKLGLVSEKDLLRLGKLIENDAITAEMYQQRLDEVLSLGAEVDEGAAGLSEAGKQVLDIWEKMDTGLISDKAEAFDEADRRVREQQSAQAEG
ncbi:MAG TPA: hypothetical protein PK184_04845 [Phycisphaerae bacterium]|jgi:hypothetical protein|nr:hypothetical protein [Phycisphaerae bacterium]HOL25843.1 hypothetical protein [Phycisphaerae bacterium]HPP21283.1 hypothetical protein [Phycisphaerae bacterium]HPU32003.1 hypothetical protein [Phycisphaerae bacterium]HXK84892.1 hypothetical protein [Phycisphaerae bacterium]